MQFYIQFILGELNVAKVLIDNGANINAGNVIMTTPLHYAASHNYVDVIKYLIQRGANIEARDVNNNTPLHLAASLGIMIRIIKLKVLYKNYPSSLFPFRSSRVS